MEKDALGRPLPTSDNPPHLWLVAPPGYLCVLCKRFWHQVGYPYEPCSDAPEYAKEAIKAAEKASGMVIQDLYNLFAPVTE